jgi:hypothetical protein
MTPGLSQRTRQLVDSLFDPIDINEACLWLEEECGNNLPFCDDSDEFQMERIRFAALKLSKGNPHKLLRAIEEARMDWRDLLMAAGFGTDENAHETWAKEVLRKP